MITAQAADGSSVRALDEGRGPVVLILHASRLKAAVPTGIETLRVAVVGTFPPTPCGLATLTESVVRSISRPLLIAGVLWKAQGTDNFGARGMCRATGRATYGALLWRERS